MEQEKKRFSADWRETAGFLLRLLSCSSESKWGEQAGEPGRGTDGPERTAAQECERVFYLETLLRKRG